MKKVLMVGVFAVIVVGLMGCASPGGMTYVGPISYYHAKSADKAMMMRTVSMSRSIVAEKKEPIFKAVNMGSSPNEIAVGVGIDVGNLISGDYTGSEIAMQLLSSLGDSLIYGGIGYGAYKAVQGNNSETRNTTVYTINGDNNNINGSGNQSNNSASNGGANGNLAVGQ